MIRTIQIGQGEQRILVLLFLVGESLDTRLREVLGSNVCIMADVKANDPQSLADYLAEAERVCGCRITGYVLGGWSAGVGKVRSLLGDGCNPLALVLADGTHASKPPEKWQLDVWTPYVERGRKGEMVFAASHIFNTYVESLPRPYLSTVSVLRLLTGLALEIGGPLGAPVEHHDGELHVYSYSSSSCDAVAHGKQVMDVLPMMLEKHVRPIIDAKTNGRPRQPEPFGTRTLRVGMVGDDVRAWQTWLFVHGFEWPGETGEFVSSTENSTKSFQRSAGLAVDGVAGPNTFALAKRWPWPCVYEESDEPLWHSTTLTLGQRAVRWSLSWLGRLVEVGGPNKGPLIEAMFSVAKRRATDKPIDVISGEWCAACFSCASNAALLDGQPPSILPHSYRVAVIELVQDTKAANAWADVAMVRDGRAAIHEGDGVTFARGEWEGHVSRVLRFDETTGELWTVGGNEGDMVRIAKVHISDANLRGFIIMPRI
mgnify:FL=1